MHRRVYSIRCIDQREEFTKATIPIIERAQDGLTVKRLEFVDDDISNPTTELPTNIVDFYPKTRS